MIYLFLIMANFCLQIYTVLKYCGLSYVPIYCIVRLQNGEFFKIIKEFWIRNEVLGSINSFHSHIFWVSPFYTISILLLWYIHLKCCENIIMHFESTYHLYCVTVWPKIYYFPYLKPVDQLDNFPSLFLCVLLRFSSSVQSNNCVVVLGSTLDSQWMFFVTQLTIWCSFLLEQARISYRSFKPDLKLFKNGGVSFKQNKISSYYINQLTTYVMLSAPFLLR